MTSDPNSPFDMFGQFWSDFASRVNPQAESNRGGASTATASPAFSEASKQMQRVFFDTMAKYLDDYMRSEQFLLLMKQTMDRSLAMKQQLDQFVGQLQRGMQAPVKGDVEDLTSALRSFEDRVISRLEKLEQKTGTTEKTSGGGRSTTVRKVKRSTGRGAISSVRPTRPAMKKKPRK